MKNLTISFWVLLLTLATVCTARAQSSDAALYNMDRLMSMEGITVISISPSMFSSQMEGVPAQMTGLTKDLQSVLVFSAETPKEMKALREEFKNLSNPQKRPKNYKQLVFVKEGKEQVEMIGVEQGRTSFSTIYIIVDAPDEYTLISMSGKFSKEDVERDLR